METIKEVRIVTQEWYEFEFSKTGWEGNGWVFRDDGRFLPPGWTVVSHIRINKFGNPFLGIAEKETTI